LATTRRRSLGIPAGPATSPPARPAGIPDGPIDRSSPVIAAVASAAAAAAAVAAGRVSRRQFQSWPQIDIGAAREIRPA